MKSIETIVAYRLQKSEDMFTAAEALAAIGQWDSVVNRLYYAAYHAVSALVYYTGGKAKTHSGLKNIFHELFIKPGKLNMRSGETYEILYVSRHDADYADFVTFEELEIRPPACGNKSIFGRN